MIKKALSQARRWLVRSALANQDLRYRLLIIFAFFFFVPLLGFIYYAAHYDLLNDPFTPWIAVGLLAACLFGYTQIRRIFDEIFLASKQLAETLPGEPQNISNSSTFNEMSQIIHSFENLKKELHTSFGQLDQKVSQISTLKELSDLCYVTFDADDLFHITLERALKLIHADIGSILILDLPKRTHFLVTAAIGHGDQLKKGDCIDYNASIAKFAVINKSPLIVDDIETDSRFRRSNRSQYATKGFLCMPLKGITEVLGVLTLSRRQKDLPFRTEDAEILTPLLSNAALAFDNLNLKKAEEEKTRKLLILENLSETLNSSLQGQEMEEALIGHLRRSYPFDLALILLCDPAGTDQVLIHRLASTQATALTKETRFSLEGSLTDRVIRHGSSLLIEDKGDLVHPLEKTLLDQPGITGGFLFPLKVNQGTVGVLLLGTGQSKNLRPLQLFLESFVNFLALAMEKNRLSAEVAQRYREIDAIKQIGSLLAASTFDTQNVMKHTMEMVHRLIDVEAGSLLLLRGEELEFQVTFNLQADVRILQAMRIRQGQGIAGYVAERGEPLVLRDARQSQYFDPHFDQQTGFQTRTALCVPLISKGRVLGVIELLNKRSGDFLDGDLHLVQSVATTVSIALENSRLYQETRTMAEQERGIRQLFQKYVPKEVVDKIIHPSDSGPVAIEELKTLTLLNLDIRGFSRISNRIGPKRTVAVLNHFFQVMGEIVFNHHGIVDKYLGDGFLAIFGAPIQGAQDADNAVRAALKMRQALPGINDQWTAAIDATLEIGISVHTGEVVVGNIGFDKKMDYTVIGDSVNVVFQLQDLARSRPNAIIISNKTQEAVTQIPLNLKPIEPAEENAAPGAMSVYELLDSEPSFPPRPVPVR